MATLKDLKPSLTDLPQKQLLDLIAETRRKRLSPVEKPPERVSFYKATTKLSKAEALELLQLLNGKDNDEDED